MLEDASRCYTAARSRDVRPPLALSGCPPGLLPKPIVGFITHRQREAILIRADYERCADHRRADLVAAAAIN